MAEAIWYFADGDVERGPVTEAQLRALIGTGNLTADDLVWKEGMDDWALARDVPGLFDQGVPQGTAETPKAKLTKGTAKPEEPAAAAAATPKAAAKAPRAAASYLDVTKPIAIFRYAAFLGQPLLLFGFLLVLGSRGCDSLGDRQAARAEATAKLAENQFQDEWDLRKTELEQQRDELQDKPNPTPVDQKALEQVNEALRKLDEDQQTERDKLRNGPWRHLTITARDAAANNQISAFWRQSIFVVGSLFFSLGLLIVGFSGPGPERWLSLVLLAIVVFSLFVGRWSP